VSAATKHAERHPVGGVVPTKITLGDENTQCSGPVRLALIVVDQVLNQERGCLVAIMSMFRKVQAIHSQLSLLYSCDIGHVLDTAAGEAAKG